VQAHASTACQDDAFAINLSVCHYFSQFAIFSFGLETPFENGVEMSVDRVYNRKSGTVERQI
jgi:hypothetical protein